MHSSISKRLAHISWEQRRQWSGAKTTEHRSQLGCSFILELNEISKQTLFNEQGKAAMFSPRSGMQAHLLITNILAAVLYPFSQEKKAHSKVLPKKLSNVPKRTLSQIKAKAKNKTKQTKPQTRETGQRK